MIQFLTNSKNYISRIWHGIRLLPNLKRNQIPLILDSFTKKDFISLSAFAALFVLAGGFLIYSFNEQGDGTSPDFGGEIVEGLVGQPQFINPILSPASSVDSDISKAVYAQLLKFDEKLSLIADLAVGLPEVSEDQKVYTLKLKSGLMWHDNKPIMADDIIYTVETIQNADYESPLSC